MFSISRDVSSLDLVIRISGIEEMQINPRGVAEELRKNIMDFLAKEFLNKYQTGILGAINADDVAYHLAPIIAEFVKQNLLKARLSYQGDSNV